MGGSGFVGTEVAKYFALHNYIVSSPPSNLLDITKIDSIKKYSENNDVIVNLAGYADVKSATLNINGPAWKLNVEGVRNVAKVCKQTGKYLIHISTDAVFPFDKYGPHSELEKIVNYPKFNNPYGFTKLQGEIEINKSEAKAAIIRISYPFGNPHLPNKDYVMKIIKLIKLGYPLYTDQQLTPTYLKSLPEMIERLIELRLSGIFHWVCKGSTTPYKIGSLVNKELSVKLKIKKDSLYKNEETVDKHYYAKSGGLTTDITEGRINLKPPTWEDAIRDFMPTLKDNI